ncbi:ATP-binding protein [Corynebacterium variabile]|uniref:ATP-binding protein n=1 Tax=Corynebacterium variabile TaxID=1727 RepID=UPI001DB0377E|nr:ATP-binding protein [Corynebacterium variabile]HJG46998.1 PspC domain-containing protein [Corynebacterium variabile]
MTTTSVPERQAPPAPELYRVREGRVLSGVCAGLGAHLGVAATTVRLVFVVSCLAVGIGAVAYVALRVLTRQVPTVAEATNPLSARRAGAVTRPVRAVDRLMVPLALVLCVVGVRFSVTVGVTTILVLGGGVMVWRTFGPDQLSMPSRITGRTPARSPGAAQWTGMLGGLLLITAGLGFWAWRTWGGAGSGSFLPALIASVILVVGVLIVLIPLWLKLWSTADAAARDRAATEERARIAARIHDSVLQTLTVIQRQSDQPEIAKLARTQERQLRQWLFGAGESVSTGTLFGGLRVASGEVEDMYGVQIRPVTVGEDLPVDNALMALLQAGRECMVNAAKHSGCDEVNVYCEVGRGVVELFVRDRGCGFDPETVPADRHGLRGSVIGRMREVGGTVTVDSGSFGTEVTLHLNVSAEEDQ